MKKTYLLIGVVVILILGFFALNGKSSGSFENIDAQVDVKIYKSITCGCCDVYVNYFQRKGTLKAEEINGQSVDPIKDKYGVPNELRSCHTTIIGDYFVEGHIPLEAVEKLLSEKPNIKGIAMPGMPEGSPGMPGNKRGDFVIYSVNNDGSYQEFMRI